MKEYFDKTFCLEVWGDYACFTRPEMKVERVSYDVITPSAARAVFEAIFWKPAFYWKMKKIEVLNPIKWINLRRNEVGAVAGKSESPIYIEEKRQQRAGLFLRDVKYRIYADLVFIPPQNRQETQRPLPEYLLDSIEKNELMEDRGNENPAKYNAMFERRAKKGQCEFAQPIPESRDLGFMLYDMDYSDNNIKPAFFRAKMENGVIVLPDWDSGEVLK